MYLSASELQQYRGQWLCPYCLQDARDKDRLAAEAPARRRRERYVPPTVYTETCERCGKSLSTVYVWNGRKLCKPCLEEGKKTWDLVTGKPFTSPMRIKVEKKKKSVPAQIFEGILFAFLGIFGIKRKKKVSEIVVVKDVKEVAPLPEFGKPLVSESMKEEAKPQAEGLMKGKKKKKKKK